MQRIAAMALLEDLIMSPEVYQAITAIFGLLIASVLRLVHKKLKAAEVRIKSDQSKTAEDLFAERVKNLRLSIREFNPIAKTINRACIETKIDRVLILTCVNGLSKPKRATVLWDANDEDIWTYDDVPLDTDYQDRVQYIIKNSHLQFKTEEARNTKIYGFYQIEGVKESIWIAIAKMISIDTDQVAYMYMSVATHGEDDMGNDEVRVGQNIASLMRNIVSTHGYRPI